MGLQVCTYIHNMSIYLMTICKYYSIQKYSWCLESIDTDYTKKNNNNRISTNILLYYLPKVTQSWGINVSKVVRFMHNYTHTYTSTKYVTVCYTEHCLKRFTIWVCNNLTVIIIFTVTKVYFSYFDMVTKC